MNSAHRTNAIRLGGAFLIVISVLLLIIAAQGRRYANYQSSGVTTQAAVIAKSTARTRQVSGSQLYRSDYLLDVTFSTGPAAAAQPSAPGKFITTAALVDDQQAAGLKKGDRVSVIYLPDDPQNTVVVKAALDAGTLDLAPDQAEHYRQSGITAEATVDQIDAPHRALRVMFMTRLTPAHASQQIAATLDVNKSTWDAVEQGGQIEVVYLPDDPANNVVAKRTLEEGGVNPYLMLGLAAVALLGGLFLLWKYRATPRRNV